MPLRSKTPGLLQRMTEHKVEDLVVRRDSIIEPRTDCRVASGFPSTEAAIAGDGGKGMGVDKLCAQIVAAVEQS